MQELAQLQDKHATRPDVFDDVEEEQEIEILTQEISQVSLVLWQWEGFMVYTWKGCFAPRTVLSRYSFY